MNRKITIVVTKNTTVISLKEYGEYIGYDENIRAYIYRLNNKLYAFNGKGLIDLN